MSTISCPHCLRQYPFQPALVGKQVRCAGCQQVFEFPASLPIPILAQPPATPPFNPLAAAPTAPTAFPPPPIPGLSGPPSFGPYSAPPALGAYPANPAGPAVNTAMETTSVPPQFGQVVRQFAYGYSTTIATWMTLALGLGAIFFGVLWASGVADRMVFRGTQFRLTYACMALVPLCAAMASLIPMMTAIHRAYPRIIAVTALGVYLPRHLYSWRMVFVPYSNRPTLRVDQYGMHEDITIKDAQGKFVVGKMLLPSNAEFQELVQLLRPRLAPG